MATSRWRLAVRSEFSASHALRNYNGKCENIHGHNFFVEVTIEGSKLSDDTELLVDFSCIKRDLKAVLETIDHKDLNSTPPFDKINPTSENLAKYIFQMMVPNLKDSKAHVYSVTVGEKAAQSATYYEL